MVILNYFFFSAFLLQTPAKGLDKNIPYKGRLTATRSFTKSCKKGKKGKKCPGKKGKGKWKKGKCG